VDADVGGTAVMAVVSVVAVVVAGASVVVVGLDAVVTGVPRDATPPSSPASPAQELSRTNAAARHTPPDLRTIGLLPPLCFSAGIQAHAPIPADRSHEWYWQGSATAAA
jgi:hypothetical protein